MSSANRVVGQNFLRVRMLWILEDEKFNLCLWSVKDVQIFLNNKFCVIFYFGHGVFTLLNKQTMLCSFRIGSPENSKNIYCIRIIKNN